MDHDFDADFTLFPRDDTSDNDMMDLAEPQTNMNSQPDYSALNTSRRSRSPTRDRENNNYRDQRSPANAYDRSDRRPSRSEQTQGNMEDRAPSQQDRRVYVGNLAYDVKWHHLKDHMREGMFKLTHPSSLIHRTILTSFTAGTVLYADVLELPNGMSKGCGIVEYSTKDEAQTAINTLSNRNLMGRLIYVREVRTSTTTHSSSTDTNHRTARLSRASMEPAVPAVAWVDHAEALLVDLAFHVAVSVEASVDLACRVAARRSSFPTYVHTCITHSRPKN
jgi:RNA recognition motif-containing protein